MCGHPKNSKSQKSQKNLSPRKYYQKLTKFSRYYFSQKNRHKMCGQKMLSKLFKALIPKQKTATKCVAIGNFYLSGQGIISHKKDRHKLCDHAAGQTYHPKKKKELHCSLVNWLFLQKPVKRLVFSSTVFIRQSLRLKLSSIYGDRFQWEKNWISGSTG